MTDQQLNAKIAVVDHYNEQGYGPEQLKGGDRTGLGEEFDEVPPAITVDDVYVVWYAYVLGCWKAVLSTKVADNRYYAFTHNVAKDEAYLDVYIKESNNLIK